MRGIGQLVPYTIPDQDADLWQCGVNYEHVPAPDACHHCGMPRHGTSDVKAYMSRFGSGSRGKALRDVMEHPNEWRSVGSWWVDEHQLAVLVEASTSCQRKHLPWLAYGCDHMRLEVTWGPARLRAIRSEQGVKFCASCIRKNSCDVRRI